MPKPSKYLLHHLPKKKIKSLGCCHGLMMCKIFCLFKLLSNYLIKFSNLPTMPFYYPLIVVQLLISSCLPSTEIVQCGFALVLQSVQIPHLFICTCSSKPIRFQSSTFMLMPPSSPFTILLVLEFSFNVKAHPH